jgi:peroxiredoxin
MTIKVILQTISDGSTDSSATTMIGKTAMQTFQNRHFIIWAVLLAAGIIACTPQAEQASIDCPPCPPASKSSASEAPAPCPTAASDNAPEIPTRAQDVHPILTGTMLPPISLKTEEGAPFNLNDAIRRQNTVLLFFRGGWCPYCNAQLSKLKTVEQQIRDAGFQIIAVSADRPPLLQSHAKENHLGYRMLSDAEMTASRALGIAFRVDDDTYEKYINSFKLDLEERAGQKHHLLPVPAVFLVNTSGIVEFSYVNPDYKTRLAPDLLLAAVKSMSKGN